MGEVTTEPAAVMRPSTGGAGGESQTRLPLPWLCALPASPETGKSLSQTRLPLPGLCALPASPETGKSLTAS